MTKTRQPDPIPLADDLTPATPAEAARNARLMLAAAHEALGQNGFRNIRVDQWEHPETKILVETGYTYGETRLTVHDGQSKWDMRLTGRDHGEFRRFRKLAEI